MGFPVESKVTAAVTGAGGGAAVATFGEYLIGVYVYGADATSNAGADAVAAVPSPVVGILAIALAALGAFVFGFLAPHTSRSDAITVATVTPSGVTPVVSDLADPDAVGDVPPSDQDTDVDHTAGPQVVA